jgi:hypothetical protein
VLTVRDTGPASRPVTTTRSSGVSAGRQLEHQQKGGNWLGLAIFEAHGRCGGGSIAVESARPWRTFQ